MLEMRERIRNNVFIMKDIWFENNDGLLVGGGVWLGNFIEGDGC